MNLELDDLIRDDAHFIELNKSAFLAETKYQLQQPLEQSLDKHWDYISNVFKGFGQIFSTLDLDHVLEYVIDSLISVIQAERGFLLLKNPKGRLEFKIARDANHQDLDKSNFKIVKNILINTYQHRAIYYFDDVSKVQLFSNKKLEQKSIICCPLLVDRKILGLIYADSKEPLIGDSPIKQELVQHFSSQAAIAIRNAMFYHLQEESYLHLTNTSEVLLGIEKTAAESRVSASIGHLLNNFLLETSSNLELVTHYLQSNADLDKANTKLENIFMLLKELKSLSGNLVDNIHIDTKPEVCNINDLVDDFISFCSTVYQQKNPVFEKELRQDLPLVKIDKTQMHLALYNICNFLAEKTTVYRFKFETRYIDDHGRVRLYVDNSEKGFKREEIRKLFRPLENAESDLDSRFGLMVCKEIILKHQGSLTVERLDSGERFIISLPSV